MTTPARLSDRDEALRLAREADAQIDEIEEDMFVYSFNADNLVRLISLAQRAVLPDGYVAVRQMPNQRILSLFGLNWTEWILLLNKLKAHEKAAAPEVPR